MDFTAFLWLGIVTIATSAWGAGYGALGMNPARYRHAKILFWISGLSIGGIAMLFGLTVPVNTIGRLIGTGLIGAFAAIVIVESTRWVNNIEKQAEAVPKNAGRIIANTKTLFSTANQSGQLLEIGDSGMIFNWLGGNGKPLFNFFGSELIVESIGDEIKVTTQVKDNSGRLIAELIRNDWRTAPPPHTWDRNYSKDALEVIDPRGAVVLQVRALPDRIQLQGEWWGDADNCLRFVKSDNPKYPGARMIVRNPTNPYVLLQAPTIKRMFVYPSDLHLGESQ
jgi:hypothetical protein